MSIFAENHAKNLTNKTIRETTKRSPRPYPETPIEPIELQVGDDVSFHGLRVGLGYRHTTVRAVSEHYAIVTWVQGGEDRYAVIGWQEGWRGPHGSWGHGAVTDEDCRGALAALEAGEIEMSHRSSVFLDIVRVMHEGWVSFLDDGRETAS